MSLREGETISELKKLIDEEKDINVLVLAAKSDENNNDPGPIITSLVSNEITNLRVPIMRLYQVIFQKIIYRKLHK